jgi:uncharacterized protein with PhoU and TrkA domain
VISRIERIANDRGRHRPHRHAPPRHPRELVADLSNAEEVSHRVRVRDGSHLARRPLVDLELPVQTGMRIVAIRRDREWITDVEGEEIMLPATCCSSGLAGRHPRLRELAAAPRWEPPTRPRTARSTDLDRAVDVLVEMKNVSETAVGLAYSALVLRDLGLAAEVRHLEDRLDEMKDRLELWVLRAAPTTSTRRRCGACCTCRRRPRTWRRRPADGVAHRAGRGVHPILRSRWARATRWWCGCRWPPGSPADGATLRSCSWTSTPASTCSRAPRRTLRLPAPGPLRLEAGDELIASGPDEGHPSLPPAWAGACEEDEDTGRTASNL